MSRNSKKLQILWWDKNVTDAGPRTSFYMFRYENTFSETSQIPDFLLAQMLHLMKRQVLERATYYGVMQPTLSATCSIFETNILKVMVLVEWLPYSAALLILSSCILVIISILLYISPTACPAYNMHRDFKHYLNYPNPFSSSCNVWYVLGWGVSLAYLQFGRSPAKPNQVGIFRLLFTGRYWWYKP